MIRLVHCFFESHSDNNYSKKWVATTKWPVVSETLSEFFSVITTDWKDEHRIAHNLSSYLKKGDNFLGKIDENVNDFLASYMEAAIDYERSSKQE